MEYKVTWTIVLDADSPEEAARQALEIHRDHDSWATHFEVREPNGKTHAVDLEYPTPAPTTVTIYVVVPMEEGIVRDVTAHANEQNAGKAEAQWLGAMGVADQKEREARADWGTGIAIWECELRP